MAALGDWLTTREAARLTGYNVEYIRRLIRDGKVKAQKWGRDWMISRVSLQAYKDETELRGPKNKPRT